MVLSTYTCVCSILFPVGHRRRRVLLLLSTWDFYSHALPAPLARAAWKGGGETLILGFFPPPPPLSLSLAQCGGTQAREGGGGTPGSGRHLSSSAFLHRLHIPPVGSSLSPSPASHLGPPSATLFFPLPPPLSLSGGFSVPGLELSAQPKPKPKPKPKPQTAKARIGRTPPGAWRGRGEDDAHATHGEEGRKFITSDIVSGVPYFPGWALRARQTLSTIASKF